MRYMDAYAILILNEKKGYFSDLGLAGAILLDLFVAQRISFVPNENPKKYPIIVIKDGSATGDSILDETLQALRDSKEPQNLRQILHTVCKHDEEKLETIYARLEHDGILRAEDVKKAFGTTRGYFLLNPEPKQTFIHDVRTFSERPEPLDFYSLALITLLYCASLIIPILKGHMENKEWRAFHRRFYQYIGPKAPREGMAGNVLFLNEIHHAIDDLSSKRSA